MEDVRKQHDDAIESLCSHPGRVFVLGGVDSGKTTFAKRLCLSALEAGHSVALVDSDIAQSTVGAPGTVGLKMVSAPSDLEEGVAPDVMSFVGTISPRDNVLGLSTGTAKLVLRAIQMGARLTVVDTSGLIDGVAGQLLNLTEAELARPHHVVGLAHGGELDPICSVLERFLSIDVMRLPAHPDVGERSVEERVTYREKRLASFLGPEIFRWRVKSTVFMPMLPPMFDLADLEGLLVGIDNGQGDCLGLGILEYREDALRLLTPVSEGVVALRLGSVKVTPEGKITERVDLRSMLGTD